MIVYAKTSSGKKSSQLGLQRYARAVAWCVGRALAKCRDEHETLGALHVRDELMDLLQLIDPPFDRGSFVVECHDVSRQCNQLRKKV